MTYFSYGFSPQFVLPAHVLRAQKPLAHAEFNSEPTVGDGPYVFLYWHRGEGLRYAANPRYWRGRPAIATLRVRTIPDPTTNLILLRSGALDWNLLAPSQLAVVRGDPHIAFRTVPTAVVAGIAFNTRTSPLDDVRVRRAIAMSIDRDEISRKITLGFYPVTNMMQPRFSWAFDPSVREPYYDPNAADRLFDAPAGDEAPTDCDSAMARRCTSRTCSFPKPRPACASLPPFKRRCASAASTSRSNRSATRSSFFPVPACWQRAPSISPTCRGRWAPIRTIRRSLHAVPRRTICGGAIPESSVSNTRRSPQPEPTRESVCMLRSETSSRGKFRFSTCSMLITFTRTEKC